MRSTHFAWTLLTIALVAGCSSSDVEEVAEAAEQVSALSSTLPLVTEFETSESQADDTNESGGPFDEDLNIFTPPKMIIPIEDDPIDDLDGDLPPLRLVGFVGAAGDKAMMAVGGKMHMVTAGKRLNGVEIVSVASPKVELRWGETDLTLDFYKPSKSDRPTPKRTPSMAFSPSLSRLGTSSGTSAPSTATTTPRPVPRPSTSLPPLPGLPSPGSSAGTDLGDFPDLGAGPGAPPAPAP